MTHWVKGTEVLAVRRLAVEGYTMQEAGIELGLRHRQVRYIAQKFPNIKFNGHKRRTRERNLKQHRRNLNRVWMAEYRKRQKEAADD